MNKNINKIIIKVNKTDEQLNKFLNSLPIAIKFLTIAITYTIFGIAIGHFLF